MQGDVLSSEQVRAFGFSRRAVSRLGADGQWQQLAYGLHLARSGPADWSARSWGGVLLGGDHARLGGRAAGHLWGLTKEPEQIEVLVPIDRSMRSRSGWTFVREQPGLRMASRGSPPRTCVEDAVIDLCSVVGEAELVGFVTAAVQERLTHPERLIRRIKQRGRVRHRKLMLELLGVVAEGSESPLEVHYVRDVERAHGLPVGSILVDRGWEELPTRCPDCRSAPWVELGVA